MKVNGKDYRTVWMDNGIVYLVEQNLLPFEFSISVAKNHLETCHAIRTMVVRGAGAIGAAAGFAMAQAFLEDNSSRFVQKAKAGIEATRPTARNLFYAVDRVFRAGIVSVEDAVAEAMRIADKDASDSFAIGNYGNTLIGDRTRIATHCNAGWLAFVDYGTALSPVFRAFEEGKDPFVYVDETRPRSQGARLTAWELNNAGIRHAIIPDNATAYFMSQGKIDLMIVGADRIAANGDVANKIGTLEKALAAKAYDVPFYVAAPLSTFDLECRSGRDIPIEFRNQDEVLYQSGPDESGKIRKILVASRGSGALNPAFDVTPASLISGIITEKGIIEHPDAKGIANIFNLQGQGFF
jgi:S-methyl-5-thioribose-1-phosphate isomerase